MTTPKSEGKPRWLRRKLPTGPHYERIRHLIKDQRLATVCQEAMCPNQFECFAKETATFMIMGERCTRNCRFCAVGHGPREQPDPQEPVRVAEAVRTLGLRYSVITSVTRDDLADGGAAHFAATIRAIRAANPQTLIEVLIPDFQGDPQALATVLDAGPDVLNHNLETVERLYVTVRPEAVYRRSLEVLRQSKAIAPRTVTKCGIMVGLALCRSAPDRL
jgi:lipoic acid synthetase